MGTTPSSDITCLPVTPTGRRVTTGAASLMRSSRVRCFYTVARALFNLLVMLLFPTEEAALVRFARAGVRGEAVGETRDLLALLVGELLGQRDGDLEAHVQVAAPAPLDVRDAAVAQRVDRPGERAGGDAHRLFALDGRDLHLA